MGCAARAQKQSKGMRRPARKSVLVARRSERIRVTSIRRELRSAAKDCKMPPSELGEFTFFSFPKTKVPR